MKTSKTWLWILIIIIVLALIGLTAWYYGFSPVATNKNVQQPASDRDTTADISSDLNSVDMGNPDEDLKQLDADLNQL